MRKSKIWSWFISVGGIAIIIVITVIRVITPQKNYSNGDTIRLHLTLTSDPVIYEKSQYLKIRGLKIYLPKTYDISYGDKIIIEGRVEGDKLKDVKLIEKNENQNILFKFRKGMVEVYRRILPSDEAGLMGGVTLGSKVLIDSYFWEKLKRAGVAHVVVASGTNITLLGGFLMGLLAGIISRKNAVILTIISIWLYAVISGLEAPIIRACLMGTIAFGAQYLGKNYLALRALFISGIVMLMLSPNNISDYGFILSFFATLSLILFSKPVEKAFERLGVIYKKLPKIAKEGITTSISAQILIFPILIIAFGSFSPLSPVANALLLWTIPLITAFGFLGGILGLIYLPLGNLVLFISYPILNYFNLIVEIFG